MNAEPLPTQVHGLPTVSMLGPGSVIAERFVVETVAGSGGVGVVYRALDRHSGQSVALKVMQHYDAEGLARFEREASALAALTHPGIVRHVAHGTTPEGQPFLVMEWLDGEDLAQRLGRGPLSVRDAVDLLQRVAQAVGTAHSSGLVHRDVKPANLFLPGGRVDDARVLDFGLVRPEGASRDVTHTGAVLGTPGYMAPEQARGGRDVDARADVFALGCVLFECLAGCPPFRGRNAVEVLSSILMDPAPRVRSLRPEVPDALDALVARMLAKQPEARPVDGVSVALELAALAREAGTASGQQIFRVDAQRTFAAPGEFIFAVFADSNRFDRLTGAPRTRYTYEPVAAGSTQTVRVGHAEMMGNEVSWTEDGEWLEPSFAWGERRFREGVPAARLGLRFEITPGSEHGNGNVDAHDCVIQLSAYALCDEATAHMGPMLEALFSRQIQRYFDAVDALLARVDVRATPRVTGEGPGAWVRRVLLRAGFDKVLSGARGEVRVPEFEQRVKAFDEAAVSANLRERLITLIRDGADEHLRELRPFELARAWELDRREVLRACLFAARAGLLDLRWELVCPTCRVGAADEGSLARLETSSHCTECQKDFAIDMATNVEAVFTVNRALREVDRGYYCASSPAFRTHVYGLLRLAGRETREVMVRLPGGRLRVRATHRDGAAMITAQTALPREIQVNIGAMGITAHAEPGFSPANGDDTAVPTTLVNDTDAPVTVLLERDAAPRDAATGAAMCAMPEFLDLFSAEAPAAGRELAVSTVALVAVEITGVEALCARVGDARAYAMVAHAQGHMESVLVNRGGAVLRAAGDAVLAVFVTGDDARAAAVEAVGAMGAMGAGELSGRAGVAEGACLMVRVRGKLDVFGKTDAAAWRAMGKAAAGEVKVVGA